MIIEFIQKALLKNEKSCSILIKDEKLKQDISKGIEIDSEILEKIYNKNFLKRKDFTTLEEIIKIDLDEKISKISEQNILFCLISEDFKRYEINFIKNKLLKKEYLYITGKTLYEHLINKKENSLEQIKQNRLLLFLDIDNKDWNIVENISFCKYFRIPVLNYYAVFFKNSENIIIKGKFVFYDSFENAEFSIFENNFAIKNSYSGKGTEISDFYRFDLDDEKHNSPAIIFIPKHSENILMGNIILADIPKTIFVSCKAIFVKAKNIEDIENILLSDDYKNTIGTLFHNNIPNFTHGNNFDNIKNQPVQTIINLLAGHYICYTIAKDKDRIRSQKLVIKKDFTVEFSSSALHFDTGYANISDADKILQIHFHLEEGEYKYNFMIHLNNNNIQAGRLQGVVCGINRLNEPFAERVYLVRLENNEIELEDFKQGQTNLDELLKKNPELLSIFLGKKNDFGTDFEALQIFYRNFYLPKLQNIQRICGVFDVFVYDAIRESIRKSVFQIMPNGNVLIKSFERGQTFQGKAEIQQSDLLYINIFKSSINENFHGVTISLLDGYEIEGITNFIAFFTGKNEKNELVSRRQVFVKSLETYENTEAGIISTHSSEFDLLNSNYFGLGNYLTGRTNNILRTDFTINHNLKRETDVGQVYFESACFSATHQDKTRALQQLENAFIHGFRNKEILKSELETGNLKLISGLIDVEKLKVEM